MSKGYDPWIGLPIWYTTSLEEIWKPGIVQSRQLLPSSSLSSSLLSSSLLSSSHSSSLTSHTSYEWEFHIQTIELNIEIIHTKSLDIHHLDYELIKKREKETIRLSEIIDMTSLSFLNEPEMIECLCIRYFLKQIYTSIGPILLAVNPFEQLDSSVYSIETIQKYSNMTLSTGKLLPHVFQTSNNAYTRMFIEKHDYEKRENQSILVNGESGAGKTESTKQILRYLSINSTNLIHSLSLETRNYESLINAINPITESFGNAKTLRNNNSSRFGKYLELSYTGSGYIHGACLQTYLLETIRVTSQGKGERNYHIFYEIFNSLSQETREKWMISSLSGFHYVNQSDEYNRYDGESDVENYHRLVNALEALSFHDEEIEEMMGMMIGLLHLGNIQFDSSSTIGEDVAIFSTNPALNPHLNLACQLLGIDSQILLHTVTKRGIKVAGNLIVKNLNVENAYIARDVLAKTTYDLLFRFLINQVNQSLAVDESSEEETASFIGVLDIFGFESFENNSFEQLCINYANEKLQDHFNYSIFKSEQEVYEEEGIKWKFDKYPDNSERLELFEHKRLGLFLLCDEQLKIPKPSDEKLITSFYTKYTSNNYFAFTRAHQPRLEFVIKHFACDVKYSGKGFVEKNRNEIAHEIFECYERSSSKLIQQFPYLSNDYLGTKPQHRDRSNSGAQNSNSSSLSHHSSQSSHTQHKKVTSLASQFSKQLTELIEKIRRTRSHFIRCIKPNNLLQPNSFDPLMVMSQLRCGGALGAVKVFQAGFPNRLDFKSFVVKYSIFLGVCGTNLLTKDIYQCLSNAKRIGSDTLWKTAATMLLDLVPVTFLILSHSTAELPLGVLDSYQISDILTGLQLGQTQLFLHVTIYDLLERLYTLGLTVLAIRLQRRYRNKLTIKATHKLASNSLLYLSWRRRTRLRSCVTATILLQRRVRIYLAQCYRKRILRRITRFKAIYRGGKAREAIRRLKYQSARLIQKYVRQYLTQQKYSRLRISTIRIQTHTRRHQAQSLKYKLLRSILLIQSIWRGTQARIKTSNYREKLVKSDSYFSVHVQQKAAAAEAKRRATEAKADFMAKLDDKLKSNPNLFFDMLDGSEKIALLSRQNELLLHTNRILENENGALRDQLLQVTNEFNELKSMKLTSPTTGRSRRNSSQNTITILDGEKENEISRKISVGEDKTQPQNSSQNRDVVGVSLTMSPQDILEAEEDSPQDIPQEYRSEVIMISTNYLRELTVEISTLQQEKEHIEAEMTKFSSEISEIEGFIVKFNNQRQLLQSEMTELIESNSKQSSQMNTPIKSSAESATTPSRVDDESKQKIGYINSQLQVLRKRKAATEKVYESLTSNPDMYTADDIQSSKTALQEIQGKISDFEQQLRQITSQSPSTQSQTPNPLTKVQSSPSLFAIAMNNTTETLKRMSSSTSFLLTPNQSTPATPTSLPRSQSLPSSPSSTAAHVALIESNIKECNHHIVDYQTKLKLLENTQDGLKNMDKQLTESIVENENEIIMIKHIIHYLQCHQKGAASKEGHTNTMENVETFWQMKNLQQQNDALVAELSSMKLRFSSMLNVMDHFSLSNFKLNPEGDATKENKENVTLQDLQIQSGNFSDIDTEEDSVSSTEGKQDLLLAATDIARNLFKGFVPSSDNSITPPKAPSSTSRRSDWSPSFIGTINGWTRNKRELLFIINVRAVGIDGIMEWTVTKSYLDFKNFRSKLKGINPDIDQSFPEEKYSSLFLISNETAEYRKEALNTYLLSVCGCENIMTSETTSQYVRHFLRVDEFAHGMVWD